MKVLVVQKLLILTITVLGEKAILKSLSGNFTFQRFVSCDDPSKPYVLCESTFVFLQLSILDHRKKVTIKNLLALVKMGC